MTEYRTSARDLDPDGGLLHSIRRNSNETDSVITYPLSTIPNTAATAAGDPIDEEKDATSEDGTPVASGGGGIAGEEFDDEYDLKPRRKRKRFVPFGGAGGRRMKLSRTGWYAVIMTVLFVVFLGLYISEKNTQDNGGSTSRGGIKSSSSTDHHYPDPADFNYDRTCIENGKFNAVPPTSSWYGVLSDLLVVPGKNNVGNAMKSINRSNPRWSGIWQNVDTRCLVPGLWYEVTADVKLTDALTGKERDCDTAMVWGDNPQSCPAVGIRIGKDLIDVGWTVGEMGDDGWRKIYGAFHSHPGLKDQEEIISLFVARAATNVDITVDDVVFVPASDGADAFSSCANPIRNGDAEVGDHRFWFIKGSDSNAGKIELTSGKNNKGYAFKHTGYRPERWRGMLQILNKDCFTKPNQEWVITAKFRYFQTDINTGLETPTSCKLDDPMDPNSCPVFQLEFHDWNTKMAIGTGPLRNEVSDEKMTVAKGGEWNEIRHTFEVTKEMTEQSEVWVHVTAVDAGYNYELDDVTMMATSEARRVKKGGFGFFQ